MVRRGDVGPEVKWVQERLNVHGCGPLGADGDFGALTEAGVRRFQAEERLGVDGIVGPNTHSALKLDPEPAPERVSHNAPDILFRMDTMGYTVFHDGQVNLIGVRSENDGANAFDDEMHVIWKSGSNWRHRTYRITTDPGHYWLENPTNVNGTAILMPGQYPVYKWDMHQGRYETLCQRAGPVKVWRDNDKNTSLDWDGEEYEGWFGINIHHSGARDSTRVDRWSAGCQVFARYDDWREVMHICRDSGAKLFIYSLLEAKDLPPSLA